MVMKTKIYSRLLPTFTPCFNSKIDLSNRSTSTGVVMANKEQQGNANKKKEAKLTLKEKRIKKQEKKSKD